MTTEVFELSPETDLRVGNVFIGAHADNYVVIKVKRFKRKGGGLRVQYLRVVLDKRTNLPYFVRDTQDLRYGTKLVRRTDVGIGKVRIG